MNYKVRKRLRYISDEIKEISKCSLQEIKEKTNSFSRELQNLSDEERSKADRMPENLQYSTRYDTFNDYADNLEDASASLQVILDDIDNSDFVIDDYSNEIKDTIESIQKII